MPRLKLTAALAAGTLGMLAPVAARAHFNLTAPPNWMTTTSDGTPQKTAPCGNETGTGQTATGVVTPVQAGQKVTVTVDATIPHPGWWRIALKEGASSTQTQTTIPDPPGTTCIPARVANPVWSTTQPILADGLGIPAGSTATNINQSGTQTYQVTIPATASCTTDKPCTLQVIMVMSDHAYPSCYYHHCADISMGGTGTTGAGGAGGGTADAGARDGARDTAGTGAGGTTGSGGTTATTGAGGASTTTGAGGSSSTTGAGGSSSTTGAGGASSTTGAGGATGEGGTTGTAGKGDSGGGGCAIGGGATLSWGALAIGLALLARRRRRRGR